MPRPRTQSLVLLAPELGFLLMSPSVPTRTVSVFNVTQAHLLSSSNLLLPASCRLAIANSHSGSLPPPPRVCISLDSQCSLSSCCQCSKMTCPLSALLLYDGEPGVGVGGRPALDLLHPQYPTEGLGVLLNHPFPPWMERKAPSSLPLAVGLG